MDYDEDYDDPYMVNIGPRPEPRTVTAPPALREPPRNPIKLFEGTQYTEYDFGQYLKVYDAQTGQLLREGQVTALNYESYELHEGAYGNRRWDEEQVSPTIINTATGQPEAAFDIDEDVRIEVYVEDPAPAENELTPAPQAASEDDCPPETDEEIDETLKGLITAWRSSLISEGSNNSISLAGVKHVLEALNRVSPFTEDSVFVDLGSGAGIPVIYAALKYRVRAYGVEMDGALVSLAYQFAKKACVTDLVSFEHRNITSLTRRWYAERGVTHVFAYDIVFGDEVREQMFDTLKQQPLYGASTGGAGKKERWNNHNIQLLDIKLPQIALTGGKSSYTFYLWKTDVTVIDFEMGQGVRCSSCNRGDLSYSSGYECTLDCGAWFCSERCFDPALHAQQCFQWLAK
jgi:hypothetical protein